ncbi:MAG: hypothetical protein ACREHD_19885, partial [Pirellulales bacterium]
MPVIKLAGPPSNTTVPVESSTRTSWSPFSAITAVSVPLICTLRTPAISRDAVTVSRRRDSKASR